MRWLVVLVCCVAGCELDKAVHQGMSEAGRNAAREVMDRFPDLMPELKDAIAGAVVAGVDRVIVKLNLKPSNSWLDMIGSGIGIILAYLLGHRSIWVRALIDYLKGKPTLQPSDLTSKKNLKDSGETAEQLKKKKRVGVISKQ